MVAIVAVSAAIALPAVRAGSRQREVRTTLQHFVAAVRRASSMAVLQRRSVELWVSPDENAYALAVSDRRTEFRAGAAVEESEEPDRDDLETQEGRKIVGKVGLPRSASFGDVNGGRYLPGDVIAFPFYPTGASGGGEIELVFEGPSGRQAYLLTIDPLIGSIAIKDEK